MFTGALLVTGAVGLAIWSQRAPKYRAPPPWCADCRYSLYGVGEKSRCPECGGSERAPSGKHRSRQIRAREVIWVFSIWLATAVTALFGGCLPVRVTHPASYNLPEVPKAWRAATLTVQQCGWDWPIPFPLVPTSVDLVAESASNDGAVLRLSVSLVDGWRRWIDAPFCDAVAADIDDNWLSEKLRIAHGDSSEQVRGALKELAGFLRRGQPSGAEQYVAPGRPQSSCVLCLGTWPSEGWVILAGALIGLLGAVRIRRLGPPDT